ncbi:MAG: glucuronate isomerase [Victivallaceae bacterium]
MAFLDDNYLMLTATGRKIFQKIKDLPVIDPHNHANVGEIAANDNYLDVWQLFAATDHYVWEVMRKRGVPEEYITGDRSNHEKFLKLAEVFPKIAGNPVYEWIHLDLRRCFGIDLLLSASTGETIWHEANAALARPGAKPLALLKDTLKVEVMCSTDDPADKLDLHDEVNRKAGRTLLRPTWRPDKAMNIHQVTWNAYIDRLEERFELKIRTFSDLLTTLKQSHDYFADHGCRASDHGVEVPYGEICSFDEADAIFRRARDGETLSAREVAAYKGCFLLEVAALDAAKNWVFQLHSGAVRDVRDSLFDNLGPDVGGDVSDNFQNLMPGLRRLLNRFDDSLKIVLYCLDPGHQPTLATMARAFGERVRLGSAWWLCDTPIGMRRQLEYIGSVDLLSCFAGMVSDSRKLLSYGSRFEMFRRVLSDVLGEMVERGQMPLEVAEELAADMCYGEVKKFFGF